MATVPPTREPGPAASNWHAMDAADAVARLSASPDGLTSAQAAARLVEYGPNELHAVAGISPWSILLGQFKNVLILVLIAATVLSAFLGHAVEAIAITVIILFAVLLGFYQEYRAERAMEALREMAAPAADVLRDGRERLIPARELVPGDVVMLRPGARVPADARLLEAVNLQIEEAPLTGESLPVEKSSAALPATALPATANIADLPIGDRVNMAYAGTSVTYGRGRALVVATGMATEFGRIARMLQSVEQPPTPLQQSLDRAGKTLAKAALVVVVVVVALGALRGQPLIELVIFGIALAVAVVPEALPAVVTISLAIGVQRMVRRNALVRRLPAVETLGGTTVICSDKTGTLTRDEMTVRRIMVGGVAGGESYDVTGAGYALEGNFMRQGVAVAPQSLSEEVKLLLRAGVLASDATLAPPANTGADTGAPGIQGDPTEGALVVAAAKAGFTRGELDTRYPRRHEIPFTSESKRMTTLHAQPDSAELVAFSKGAPELILNSCTHVQESSGVSALTTADREAILTQAQAMAAQALRVIGLAMRESAKPESAEREMTFLGLVGMIDPPRPEAQAAIATCLEAGIRPVMITGDHPITAQAVARELGLLRGGRVVTGPELDRLDDAALDNIVEEIEVYARVSPAHKLRVVTALQARGHVVAMTGDGVNDAPALKKADIGVAMGITGTDVTKEAAAMTLTDDNFASIVAAVEEGRGIFENIKKYLMFLLSSNVGEILLFLAAAVAGMPVPLTTVQILYVNLATDGLPALALAVDPPDSGLMRRRPRSTRQGIFTRPVMLLMLTGGVWSAIVNLSMFVWALGSGRGLPEAMTMTFASLTLIQFLKAYNFRSDRYSAFRKPFANHWLNRAILWELLLLALVIYLEPLHAAFGTYSLTWQDWAIVAGCAATITPVLELAKWRLRRMA